MALTLQLPIYLYILVWEKEEKLREMMKSHGMQMPAYYASHYIFSFALYSLVIAFFWLTGVRAALS